MGYSLYKTANDFNNSYHKEFFCDRDEDINMLPGLKECSPGSCAIVSNGAVYILNNSGEWKLFGSESNPV